MICKVFGVVLLLNFSHRLIGGADMLEKLISKQIEIDLQTCISNFDVYEDKIIRTQDSRDMGAKYLNEIDLGSRAECLRLCCETENCDVFVFEEKNSGSCYLFQCGPPEDFKCKFTHHINYTSGVLAVNRHLPDLESQIKLTKHEQDLTKLRKPELEAEINQPVQEQRTTSSAAPPTAKIFNLPTKSTTEARKCSRFQFECRSTGECIAIYNACDGIPQCADSSDEAPELGCPDSAPTTALPIPKLTLPNRAPMPQQPVNIPAQEEFRPSNPQQNLNSQLQQVQQDFIRPAAEPRGPFGQTYETQQYPQVGGPQINWVPHQSNQMPQSLSQYTGDKNSHIFNHKETGLQVSPGQDTRYNKYKGAMQTLHRALEYSSAGQNQYNDVNSRDYPKVVPSYYSDVYRSHISPYQENWSKNVPEYSTNNNNNNNQYINQESKDANLAEQQKVRATFQGQNLNWKTEIPRRPEPEKMAHELKNSKEIMKDAAKDVQNKPIIEKHIQQTIHETDVKYPEVMKYKITTDLEDGVTESPGGAILSLTLGLVITCFMAILIGCRLRIVRRRLRKGGKSYAHDADYLVNGMYL